MTPPHAQHRPGFHLLLTPPQLRRSLPVPSPEAMPNPDWTWCLGLWPGSSKNPQYLIFRPPPRMSSEEFCPKHLCTKNSLPPRAYTSGTPCSNTHRTHQLPTAPLNHVGPLHKGCLFPQDPQSSLVDVRQAGNWSFPSWLSPCPPQESLYTQRIWRKALHFNNLLIASG